MINLLQISIIIGCGLMDSGVSTTAEEEAGIQGLEDSFLVLGKSPMSTGPANTLAAITEAAGRPIKMTTLPVMPNGSPGQVSGNGYAFNNRNKFPTPRRGS